MLSKPSAFQIFLFTAWCISSMKKSREYSDVRGVCGLTSLRDFLTSLVWFLLVTPFGWLFRLGVLLYALFSRSSLFQSLGGLQIPGISAGSPRSSYVDMFICYSVILKNLWLSFLAFGWIKQMHVSSSRNYHRGSGTDLTSG